jgi:hypothetical protein
MAGFFGPHGVKIPIGRQGEYGTEVAVRRLGSMRAPGRLFHIRFSEDAVFRVSYARVNESVA